MRVVGRLAFVAGIAVLVVGFRTVATWALARFFRVQRTGLELGPSDFELDADDITFAGANGRALRGWFVACPGADGPRPAVLIMHGWNSAASLMLPIASLVHAAGAHALFLDACCHGRSDDDRFASMPRFAEDIEVGLRWLRSDARVEVESVVLLGHSVGAGASLLVASRDPRVAAVISVSAMAHPGELMRSAMRARGVPAPLITVILREIERAIGLPFDTFAPISTISRVRGRILLVHGGRDTVVSPDDATRLAQASGGRAQLLLIPDAEHASLDAFLLAAPTVTSFIRSAVHR